MDGRCSSESVIGGPEEVGIAPESISVAGQGSTGSGGDRRVSHPVPSSSSSSPLPKRSRRSVQKRVVSVPIADAGDGSKPKGAGECTPPPDSWTWRKYGQKPIKGSPYPRGYYRCSSSKGCPARKQVERSRVDPTMLVVTYSFDHNHPWSLPRNHGHGHPKTPAAPGSASEAEAAAAAAAQLSPPDQASDPDEKFSDLIGEEAGTPSFMISPEFGWFSDVGSPSSNSPSAADADALLYGPIFAAAGDVAMALPEEYFTEEKPAGGEEDALFAGLGELPECSVVFRRGFLRVR